LHAARRRPNKVRVPEEARPEPPHHRYLRTGPQRQGQQTLSLGSPRCRVCLSAPRSNSTRYSITYGAPAAGWRTDLVRRNYHLRVRRHLRSLTAATARRQQSLSGERSWQTRSPPSPAPLPAIAPSASRDGSRSPIDHCAAPGSVELSEPFRCSIRGCQRRWIDPFSPLGPWLSPRPRARPPAQNSEFPCFFDDP
jgi:hypothetical protein